MNTDGSGDVGRRARISGILSSHGVPDSLAGQAVQALPGQCTGLLLYGSRARNDYRPESDVDLLALVREPAGSISVGQANVSCYTPAQLRSASGTLFGMHLRRDGRVILDETGELTTIVEELEPPSARELLAKVRHYAAVLQSEPGDLAIFLPGCIRLARYLLRTGVYAVALGQGEPCFSIRELAERFNEPELVVILDSAPRPLEALHPDELLDLCRRLEAIVGKLPPNPFGTLEGLAVAEWDTDRKRASLAVLAMADSETPFDYSELPKVLL